jgi:3-oxoacyl-[acyl-carrier protein] reductase
MNNALVTGESRGIGRAICLKLTEEGFHVVINYAVNDDEAKETLNRILDMGGSGELLKFDVSDIVTAHTAVETWQKSHPNDYIEVLVNNAGIRRDNVLAFMLEDDWHRVLSITLDGFYNVTQPIIGQMLIHKYGRIVNMASFSGINGIPGQTNYSAAKGGIIAATKALAQEVAQRGITVNAVAPGFIKTDMTEGLDETALKKNIPAHRFGKPEEVAELVAFLVSPKAGYITGDVIEINGGM